MTNSRHHTRSSSEETGDCGNLVRVIEQILERRQKEMREGGVRFHIWSRDDWSREWTASELRDTVYSSYLALRSGKLKRPPTLSTVMEIGDYLECNLEERNRLLVAARYAPIPPYLRGNDLELVVKIAKQITDYIPLPSYIINRDWNILSLNEHILKFVGLTAEDVAKIKPDRLNILHLILDSELPIYRGLAHNTEIWEYIARRNIYGFKLENSISQYEDWFEPHITKLMNIPRFREFWDEIQTDWHVSESEFPYYVTEMISPMGEPVRFRSILTSLGNYDYPQIVSYIPVDEKSRTVFTEFGIPTPENGWGTNL